MTPQPDSWVEEAPTRCSASAEIAASPAEVWAVLADHESWPEWFEAVEQVTVTGERSGVGARRRVQLRGLTVDEEFVAWDVGERFAFTGVAASRRPFESLTERITIEDLGADRCRVTYTQAFAPSWWFALPLRGLAGKFRRNLVAALAALGRRVEAGPPTEG